MTEEATTVEAENQEASQDDNQSLLNVTAETIATPDPEDADGAPVMVDPDAPPDEPVAAAERPDYIEEQFWNDEDGQVDLEKLAKSYKELRVKMSAGKHKAPEDGQYTLDEVPEIPEDDEMLGEFLDIAREEGLSQEQVDKILRVYVDTQAIAQTQVEEERAKLGRNADRIIESMDGWLTNFGKSGVLSDNELNAIANAATSADFINAMNKIRKSYSEPDIPSVEASMDVQPTTMDEITSLMSDPRYGVDMHYTNQVEQKVYAMHGEKM